MKLTLVNHAGFFLETAGTSIWCDPWTKGKVVNNCCALYSPSWQVPMERVEYIWISHEHPDHFNFPTLKSIPEADRKRITVLYQRHSSPRVVDALKKMGFLKIRELPQYGWVNLKPGLRILCGSVGTMDSFLCVKSEGECILNLNDCICTDAQIQYIKRLVGKPTILMTQFSFAQWIGNCADDTDAVQQKIRELKYRIFTFQPEFTVPMASFGYFCNQENAWMNKFMISPARVMAMGLPNVNFLYPGDVWDSEKRTFDTATAVARYGKDTENLPIDPTPPPVEAEMVKEAVERLLASMKKRFGRFVMNRLKPFEVFTHDTNKIFVVNPLAGQCDVREATPARAEAARYVMCSQVAWYTFAHTWGWNVVEGSGTYLDRRFKEEGENELWRRCVTELSTDILRFNSPSRVFRTLEFLWGKKFEILYHFTGKPINDEAIQRAFMSRRPGQRAERTGEAGMTLLELIIACSILVILASAAVPLAQRMVVRPKEEELRRALREMRNAIDHYKDVADKNLVRVQVGSEGYPPDLETLVNGVEYGSSGHEKTRFLRRIPVDPMTGRAEWRFQSVQDDPDSRSWGGSNVFDVHSTSDATALDGTKYSDW